MAVQSVSPEVMLNDIKTRIERLEQEAAALRALFQDFEAMLQRVVERVVIDGEEFVVTESDMARVRARLVKPRSDETVKELALAEKIAERRKDWSEEKLRQHFWENFEAIRADAMAQGIAVDDEELPDAK